MRFSVENIPWSELALLLVAGISGIFRPVRSPPGVSGPVTVASEGGDPLVGRLLESVTTTKVIADPYVGTPVKEKSPDESVTVVWIRYSGALTTVGDGVEVGDGLGVGVGLALGVAVGVGVGVKT